MPFRFSKKSVFLTYPQCNIDATAALTLLRTKLGEANGTHYLIGIEAHADGSPHLHVFVEREERIQTRDERYFDLESHGDDGVPKVFHPNIAGPRDRSDVMKYVSKQGNVLCWPEDWDWKQSLVEKRKGQWAKATPEILAGKDARALLATMPEFVLANRRRVEEAVSFVQLSLLQANIPPLVEFLTWELPLDFIGFNERSFRDVWKCLRDNLANMGFGRKQLYLHGPTGIGKSTFLQHLMRSVRTYLIPNEDFYDHWEDSMFDLSVLDEFKGQKTIQWLNTWLDGGVSNVRKKGSQGVKNKAVPTLILSNFDPMGPNLYPNMQETTSIGTIRRRLIAVEVDQSLMHRLTQAMRLFLEFKGKPLPVICVVENIPEGVEVVRFVRGAV